MLLCLSYLYIDVKRLMINVNIVSDGPGYAEGSAPPQHSLQRQESIDYPHYPYDVQVSL